MDLISVSDPRIDLNQKVREVIFANAQNVRHYQVPFSAYSTSGTWSLGVPLPNTSIVGRTVWIKNKWRFTFAGTDQSATLVVAGSGNDAMRFLPFQNCVNNTSISFNGLSFNETSNESIDPMWRSISDQDKALTSSVFPSMQDYYQQYSLSSSYGDQLNPLASFGSRPDGNSRGGFDYTLISASNTQVVYDVTWFEPIVCAPFLPPHEDMHRKGFVNVKNISFSFNLNGDLSRAWSHSSNGKTLTSITVAIQEAPSIWLTLLEPNVLAEPVPKAITYETYRSTQYLSNEFTLTAGSSVSQVSLPSINLQGVPAKIIIYARKRLADRTYLTSDAYLGISNLSLNWNNRSNLLKEASVNDLFQISVSNGLKMNYPMFKKFTGSVIILEPKDLGLPMDQVANVLSNTQISAFADVTNLDASNSVTASLNMWVFYSSKLESRADGTWSEQTSYLTPHDVVNADRVAMVEPQGSGFFSSLVSGIQRALPIARAALPLVKVLAPPKVGQTLEAVGLGRHRARKPRGRGIVNDEDQQESLQDYIHERQ